MFASRRESKAPAPSDLGKLVRSGFLEKLPVSQTGGTKAKRRWVKLYERGVTWHEGPQAPPLNSLALNSSCEVRHSLAAQTRNWFTVKCPVPGDPVPETLRLRTSTPAELEAWVSDFFRVCSPTPDPACTDLLDAEGHGH